MPETLSVLAVNAAVIMAAMVLLWLISIRINDVSFIDSFWAFGFVIIAWLTYALADGGADPRKTLIVAITTVWGVRLGTYLFIRWREHGPDKRYVALLDKAGEKKHASSLQKVFILQGIMMLIVSLPIQFGQIPGAPPVLTPLAYAGAALSIIGILFESIGDWQLVRFKKDPANAGKVLDSGLWRYTRHPNYFGDACVFWGLYLIAAETQLGLLSAVGPALLTYTLLKWSGAALLERRLKKSRPDYLSYIERTSGFIPMPPRKGRSAAPAADQA